jgi:hypothetical protein
MDILRMYRKLDDRIIERKPVICLYGTLFDKSFHDFFANRGYCTLLVRDEFQTCWKNDAFMNVSSGVTKDK